MLLPCLRLVLECKWFSALQECLRQFEQSKATDGNPQYPTDPNQHGMAQMHAGMEVHEQVDPGHMAAAPPLEQTYQHDAIPHHQQVWRSRCHIAWHLEAFVSTACRIVVPCSSSPVHGRSPRTEPLNGHKRMLIVGTRLVHVTTAPQMLGKVC